MRNILYLKSGLCESNEAKLAGARRYAQSSHWRLQVVLYADASANNPVPDIATLLGFWKPAGVIVDSASSAVRLKPRVFGKVPVVFLDGERDEAVDCVVSDAAAVASAAARELLSLDLPNYAFVPYVEDVAWSRARGETFRSVIAQNGRPCATFRCRSRVREVFQQRLSAWLSSIEKPCGLFAVSDYVASFVIACASRARIAIPRDLVVIGADNERWICEKTSPTLTSVQLDFERAGYRAAEQLALRIAHPRRKAAGIDFGVMGIVHRESARRYRRHDGRVLAALAYIREHARDGIVVGDVVAEMGCGRRMAEILFREVADRSILDEIRAVRLELAKAMLTNTAASVPEIARDCGCGTVGRLRDLFLSAEGLPPLQWKKRRFAKS